MVERDAEHQRAVEARLAKIKHANGDVMRAQNRLIREVRAARSAGATWRQVGESLGMTQQGAQKRFARGEERAQAYELAATQSALKRARKKLADPGAARTVGEHLADDKPSTTRRPRTP